MKIGILTFHRAVNYGAVMQAYSLLTQLQHDFPEDEIEIIDYNCKEREWFKKKCPLVFLYRRSIIQGIQKYRQTKIFNQFLSYLKLSRSYLSVTNQNVENAMTNNYDMVIVGSDAVFNWEDIGLPNPYFLGETKVPHKFTYAASAHLQEYENITPKQMDYLSTCLGQFEYIGVRDKSSAHFVQYVAPHAVLPIHNCDPTVFLNMDFDEMGLQAKLKKHRFNFGKKTIFVMLMHSEYATFIRRYFGKDCQIVALMDGNPEADIYLFDLTPFEWAHVFRYGVCLITDYFHGTLLCLKNGIPVMSIDTSGYFKGHHESKSRDLLYTRLKHPELYVCADELAGENGYQVFKNRMTDILQTFDKTLVTQALDEEAKSYQPFYEAICRVHVRHNYENV